MLSGQDSSIGEEGRGSYIYCVWARLCMATLLRCLVNCVAMSPACMQADTISPAKGSAAIQLLQKLSRRTRGEGGGVHIATKGEKVGRLEGRFVLLVWRSETSLTSCSLLKQACRTSAQVVRIRTITHRTAVSVIGMFGSAVFTITKLCSGGNAISNLGGAFVFAMQQDCKSQILVVSPPCID